MLDVTFEVKGCKVSLDQFCDAMERGVIELTVKHLQKQVRDVRCPEHDTPPKIVGRRDNAGNLRWDVDGCCAKLNDAVQERMKGIQSR
jgi:hypothetical protein